MQKVFKDLVHTNSVINLFPLGSSYIRSILIFEVYLKRKMNKKLFKLIIIQKFLEQWSGNGGFESLEKSRFCFRRYQKIE